MCVCVFSLCENFVVSFHTINIYVARDVGYRDLILFCVIFVAENIILMINWLLFNNDTIVLISFLLKSFIYFLID